MSIGSLKLLPDQIHLSEGFNGVYENLSLSRCVIRFFGIPDALQEILYLIKESHEEEDKVEKTVRYLMALSMIPYHVHEHLSWAGWVSPKLAKTWTRTPLWHR